ncbi:MAG: 1-deoxy-D-xylulose-5-phosphate synthase [Pseudomonadota bacterium]
MRRIMYVEIKDGGGVSGDGRIGWVEISRSGRSYVYAGKRFNKTKSGFKYNCIEHETGAHCWISGPKKKGGDHLYGRRIDIDEDARVEYWTMVRGQPESAHLNRTA